MKWPNLLGMVRHGRSAYNELAHRIKQDPLWPQFVKEFDNDHTSNITRELASNLSSRYPQEYADYDTPLVNEGRNEARRAGLFAPTVMPLPDIVIVSPYLRTRQTREGIVETWPALGKVPYYTDENLVEREIGLAILYSNWRFFYVFYPDQKLYSDRVGYYHYRYPQGENVPDVRRRKKHLIQTIIREYAGKRVLLIAHHLSILALRANLERQSPEEFTQLDKKNPPKNCSITIYRGYPDLGKDGKLLLENYNMLAPGNTVEEPAA